MVLKRGLILEYHVYMMQRMIVAMEENGYSVHAVYNMSDARTNLRNYQFDLLIIGSSTESENDELKEILNQNQPRCKLIEGRPDKAELQTLLQ